jgi:hypothetical protein
MRAEQICVWFGVMARVNGCWRAQQCLDTSLQRGHAGLQMENRSQWRGCKQRPCPQNCYSCSWREVRQMTDGVVIRRIPARWPTPAGRVEDDDKATESRIACGYRCPSSRAFSVLAGQPKRDWCLSPAIGNAGPVKPYPSVFAPLPLPRANSADVIFPQYLVQAH